MYDIPNQIMVEIFGWDSHSIHKDIYIIQTFQKTFQMD